MLCSTIIEAIKTINNTSSIRQPLVYFYCDFQNEEKQSIVTVAGSLLRQICAALPAIPQVVLNLYRTYQGNGFSVQSAEIISAFTVVLQQLEKDAYVVIDALDEVPEPGKSTKRKDILNFVVKIADGASSKLHLLVSSRNEIDIRETLRPLVHCEVDLESQLVDSDIRKFVRSALSEGRLSTLPTSLKDNIETKIGQGAHGMSVKSRHVGALLMILQVSMGILSVGHPQTMSQSS